MCAPQKMENKHFFKLCGNTEIEEIICQLCYHDGIVPVFLFDYDWWKYDVQLNVAKRKHKTDFLHILNEGLKLLSTYASNSLK